jgi:gamma-glutamyl-gamma-aminobutyrate hydrolase PuuD
MAAAKLAANSTTPEAGPEGHIVRLLEGCGEETPHLYMDICVEGDQSEKQAFAKMFAPAKCKGVQSPLDADLVIFTGGVDVNPLLYGEEKHNTTYHSPARDRRDQQVWDICVENGIPMLGICRGAQFGAVMKGAKLYQDVNNHNQDHTIWDIRKSRQVPVSSVHHQMVIADIPGGMIVIADANNATERWKNPTEKVSGKRMDVEAFWYPDVAFLGIQGHPEYAGYDEFRLWSLKLIEELIWFNPDVKLENNLKVRRLTKEHRDLAKLQNIQRTVRSLN